MQKEKTPSCLNGRSRGPRLYFKFNLNISSLWFRYPLSLRVNSRSLSMRLYSEKFREQTSNLKDQAYNIDLPADQWNFAESLAQPSKSRNKLRNKLRILKLNRREFCSKGDKKARMLLTRGSRERARLNSACNGTRVGFGMRYTCYNSPGAVITHDTASTVDSRAWAELPSYLLLSMRAWCTTDQFPAPR